MIDPQKQIIVLWDLEIRPKPENQQQTPHNEALAQHVPRNHKARTCRVLSRGVL